MSKKDSMENKRKLVISCTMQISHYGPLREDSKKFKKKRTLQILECLLVSVLRNIDGKLYFVVSLQDSLHFLDY